MKGERRTKAYMKVLVADDEFYARKALVKILKEIDSEIAVVADVETGIEVLDYLQSDPAVDVVLTDIRMPVMDGLRLAEQLQKEYPKIAVIVETGYADFKYAQQAIRYGVRNYITKPIVKEELKKTLEDILKSKQEEEKRVRDQVLESIFEFSREELSVKELAQSADLREQFMGKCNEYASQYPYCVLLMQADAKLSFSQKEEILQRLREPFCEPFYFQNNREFVILKFFESDSVTESDLRNHFHCANLMLSVGKEVTKNAISVAVSPVHRGMEELYDAYKEAVYAINQRLLQGWDRVFFFGEKKKRLADQEKEYEISLQSALQRYDYSGAEEALVHIFEEPELLQNGDIYNLYERIIRVLGILSAFYHNTEATEGKMGLMFSRRYDLYNFKHMDELENYLLGMIKEICCFSQNQQDNKRDIIQEITEYISRSYQYDISLQDLAEKKYFMNASYLSRLFKATVGKTFSKYLIEYRLEKSRGLLEKTILKVSDIATHVGYNDVSHYIQSFRKVYGVTPEEYRGTRAAGHASAEQIP